ncbi:Dynein heavy chain domain-1 [Trinorchestia longiramus]|nr:Dynein heavy chain domain-1 [Trinorchestia longiramus]
MASVRKKGPFKPRTRNPQRKSSDDWDSDPYSDASAINLGGYKDYRRLSSSDHVRNSADKYTDGESELARTVGVGVGVSLGLFLTGPGKKDQNTKIKMMYMMKKKRRADAEQKTRRGDTDPRCEYIFQVLGTCTGVPRHQVMDFVFEENLLDDLGKFLSAGEYHNMVWFYQAVEEELPEVEITEDDDQTQVDTEDDHESSKPQRSPLKPPSATSRRNSEQSSPSEMHESRRNSTGTEHSDDGGSEGRGSSAPGKRMRLFVGDPRLVPLTGICEVNFGVLRAGTGGVILRAMEAMLRRVFVPAVRLNPGADPAAGGTARDHLLAGLRSFASCLNVSDQILQENTVLGPVEGGLDMKGGALSGAQQLLNNPEHVATVERTARSWLQVIESVLIEMEQLRLETDAAGPQDELEYWKKRMAKFTFLAQQMDLPHVRGVVLVLQLSRSKLLETWQLADDRVTKSLAEAKDNSKFVYSIEEHCHPLYLNDPPGMLPYIMPLFNTIRMIHSVSRFYNTSEKLSALLIKITNQMIRACQVHVSHRGEKTIWTQPRPEVRRKINDCLRLSAAYRKSYEKTKVYSTKTLKATNENPPVNTYTYNEYESR